MGNGHYTIGDALMVLFCNPAFYFALMVIVLIIWG